MRISDWSSDVCSSDLWWPACRHPYGSRPGECARAGCRGAGLNAFSSIALREFRRAWRGGGLWPPIAFFVLVAILFPFAIGPDSRLLARAGAGVAWVAALLRSEEHTSELQSLMRNSYAVFCLKKK